MELEFIGAVGSTVTVLIKGTGTNGDQVRVGTYFDDGTYQSNYDSNGDGVFDAVKKSFTAPQTGGTNDYSIHTDGDGPSAFLGYVDDRSSLQHRVHFSDREFDLPTAYLGSIDYRDEVDGRYLDWIAGNGGNDYLIGGKRDQTMLGGTGNDHLFGKDGDDVLDGGNGRDTLSGGDGADTFVFAPDTFTQRDVVTDFTQAQHDRVDLSAFEGLRFVDAFTGDGPEVRFRALDDRTALIFDLNGDGVEDARISFTGHIDFTQADLILPG